MEDKLRHPLVQTYINTLQGIIGRMGNNSLHCKTWTVTLVSALLTVLVTSNNTSFIGLAYFPVILFGCLDCSYLAHERCFRAIYGNFIKKINDPSFALQNIVACMEFDLKSKTPSYFFGSLSSWAIWPFYLSFIALVFYVQCKT